MSTNPPKLTEEQKADILNEVVSGIVLGVTDKLADQVITDRLLNEQKISQMMTPLRALAFLKPERFIEFLDETFLNETWEFTNHPSFYIYPLLSVLAPINPPTFIKVYKRDMRNGFSTTQQRTSDQLHTLIPYDLEGYAKLYEVGLKHRDRHVRVEAAISLEGVASRDLDRYVQLYELAMASDCEYAKAHARTTLEVVQGIDRQVFKNLVGKYESDSSFAEWRGAGGGKVAPPCSIEDVIATVGEGVHSFLVSFLDSKLVRTKQDTLREPDEIETELKKLVENPRRDYQRLATTLEAGQAEDLDEIVECAEIRIPGYTLVRKLGEGGSGVVYQAKKRLARVPRKIKIFRTRDLHPNIQAQRDRRELMEIVMNQCDILAGLPHHPHLVRYFDHGPYTTQEGEETFYMVMEYVPGVTAEEALPALHFGEKVLIALRMRDAINFLHGHGYILRDIKLNNTIVSRDKIVITDLETITLMFQSEKANRLTRGSDKYAAPELQQGGAASPESDIYALAAYVLYLLQGRVGGLEQINTLPEKAYQEALKDLVNPVFETVEQRELTRNLGLGLLDFSRTLEDSFLYTGLSFNPLDRRQHYNNRGIRLGD